MLNNWSFLPHNWTAWDIFTGFRKWLTFFTISQLFQSNHSSTIVKDWILACWENWWLFSDSCSIIFFSRNTECYFPFFFRNNTSNPPEVKLLEHVTKELSYIFHNNHYLIMQVSQFSSISASLHFDQSLSNLFKK